MKKSEKKYAEVIVFTVSVLVAKLVFDMIMKLAPTVSTTHHQYYDVMIGMALIVLVFYPLSGFVQNLIEAQVVKLTNSSKNLHKSNLVGMTIAFLGILVVIFGCFLKIKFDVNILADAWEAIKNIF